MLAQAQDLVLVVAMQLTIAVENLGSIEGAVEVQLEEHLAVFEEEGHVVGTDLEDRADREDLAVNNIVRTF